MNTITPEVLEEARDPRSTSALLGELPHMGEWAGRPDRESDWWISPRNYSFYAGLAAWHRPKSVLEIGVRFGYALISIFRGNPGLERILGLDTERDRGGSQKLAASNVRHAGFTGSLNLVVSDRSWLTQAGNDASFDLIHVDALHEALAVDADIRTAWTRLAPGGILIADDTDYIRDVRPGVERAKPSLPELAAEFYFPTFRGWWVAQKGGGRPAP